MRNLISGPKFSLLAAAAVILMTLVVWPIGNANAEKMSLVENQKEKRAVDPEDLSFKEKRSIKYKGINYADPIPDRISDKPIYFKKWDAGSDLANDDTQYSSQGGDLSRSDSYDSDDYGYDDDEYDHVNYKRFDMEKDKYGQQQQQQLQLDSSKLNKDDASPSQEKGVPILTDKSADTNVPEQTTIELLNFETKSLNPSSEEMGGGGGVGESGGASSSQTSSEDKEDSKVKPLALKKPLAKVGEEKETLADDKLKKKTEHSEQKSDDMKDAGNDKNTGNVKLSDSKMAENKNAADNKVETDRSKVVDPSVARNVQAAEPKDAASDGKSSQTKLEEATKSGESKTSLVEKDPLAKELDIKLMPGKEDKEIAKTKEDDRASKETEANLSEDKSQEIKEEMREKSAPQFVDNRGESVAADYKDGLDNMSDNAMVDDEKGSEELKDDAVAGLRDYRSDLPYAYKEASERFHPTKYMRKKAVGDPYVRRKLGSRSMSTRNWDAAPLSASKDSELGKSLYQRGPKEPYRLDFPLAELEDTDYHRNFMKSLKRFKGMDDSSRILGQGDTPNPYADAAKKQLASRVIEEEQRKRRSRLRRLKASPLFASIRKRERDDGYVYGPSARARMQYGESFEGTSPLYGDLGDNGMYRRGMQGFDAASEMGFKRSPAMNHKRRGIGEMAREWMEPVHGASGRLDRFDDDDEIIMTVKNKRRDTAGFYDDERSMALDNVSDDDDEEESHAQKRFSRASKRKAPTKSAFDSDYFGQKKKFKDVGLYSESNRFGNTPLVLLQRNDNGEQSMKTFIDGRLKNENGIDSEDLARLLSRDSNYVVLKKMPGKEQMQKVAESSMHDQHLSEDKSGSAVSEKKEKMKFSQMDIAVNSQRPSSVDNPAMSKVVGSYSEAKVESPALKKKESSTSGNGMKDLSDLFRGNEQRDSKELDEKKELTVTIDNHLADFQRGEPDKKIMYKPPLSQAYRHMKEFEGVDRISDSSNEHPGAGERQSNLDRNTPSDALQGFSGADRVLKSFKKEGKEVVILNRPFNALALKVKNQETVMANSLSPSNNLLSGTNAAVQNNLPPIAPANTLAGAVPVPVAGNLMPQMPQMYSPPMSNPASGIMTPSSMSPVGNNLYSMGSVMANAAPSPSSQQQQQQQPTVSGPNLMPVPASPPTQNAQNQGNNMQQQQQQQQQNNVFNPMQNPMQNSMFQLKLPETKATENRKYYLFGSDNDMGNAPKHEIKVIQSDFGIPQDNSNTLQNYLQNYNKNGQQVKNSPSSNKAQTPGEKIIGGANVKQEGDNIYSSVAAADYGYGSIQQQPQCMLPSADKKALSLKDSYKRLTKKESGESQANGNLKRFMRDFQDFNGYQRVGVEVKNEQLPGMSLQELTGHGEKRLQKLNTLLKDIINNKAEASGASKNMKRGMFQKYKDQKSWQRESPEDTQGHAGKWVSVVYDAPTGNQPEFMEKKASSVKGDAKLKEGDPYSKAAKLEGKNNAAEPGKSTSARLEKERVEASPSVYSSKRNKRQARYDLKDATKVLEVRVQSTPYMVQPQFVANPYATTANAYGNSNTYGSSNNAYTSNNAYGSQNMNAYSNANANANANTNTNMNAFMNPNANANTNAFTNANANKNSHSMPSPLMNSRSNLNPSFRWEERFARLNLGGVPSSGTYFKTKRQARYDLKDATKALEVKVKSTPYLVQPLPIAEPYGNENANAEPNANANSKAEAAPAFDRPAWEERGALAKSNSVELKTEDVKGTHPNLNTKRPKRQIRYDSKDATKVLEVKVKSTPYMVQPQFVANPYVQTNGYTGSYANPYTNNAYGNANANAYGNANSNAYGNANSNAYGNANTNTFGNPNANAFGAANPTGATAFGNPTANTFGLPTGYANPNANTHAPNPIISPLVNSLNQQQKNVAKAALQLPPDKIIELLNFYNSERDQNINVEDQRTNCQCGKEAPPAFSAESAPEGEETPAPRFGRRLLSIPAENEPPGGDMDKRKSDCIRKSFGTYLDPLVHKLAEYENKSCERILKKREIELDESMPNDFQNFLVTSLGGLWDQKREVVKKDIWESDEVTRGIIDGNREPDENHSSLGKRHASRRYVKRSINYKKNQKNEINTKEDAKKSAKEGDATNIKIRIVDGNGNDELVAKAVQAGGSTQYSGKMGSSTANQIDGKTSLNPSKSKDSIAAKADGAESNVHELYLITNTNADKRKKKKYATPRSDQTPQKQPISNHLPQVETVYNPSPGGNKAQIEKINSNDAQLKMKCIAKPQSVYNATASMMEDNIIRNNLRTGNINTFTYQRREEPTPYPLQSATNTPSSSEFETLDSKSPARPKSFAPARSISAQFARSSLVNPSPDIVYKDNPQQFTVPNPKPTYSKQSYEQYQSGEELGAPLHHNSNAIPYRKDYSEEIAADAGYSESDDNSFAETRLDSRLGSDYAAAEVAQENRDPVLSIKYSDMDRSLRPGAVNRQSPEEGLNPKMVEMWNEYAKTHLSPEKHQEAMEREFQEAYAALGGQNANLNTKFAGPTGRRMVPPENPTDEKTSKEQVSSTKKRAGQDPPMIGTRFFYTYKTEVPEQEYYALLHEPGRDESTKDQQPNAWSQSEQLNGRDQSQRMGQTITKREDDESESENIRGYLARVSTSSFTDDDREDQEELGPRTKRDAKLEELGKAPDYFPPSLGEALARWKRSETEMSEDESNSKEKRLSSGHLTENNYKKYHRKNKRSTQSNEDVRLTRVDGDVYSAEADLENRDRRDALADTVRADMMRRINEEKKARNMVKNLKVELSKNDVPIIAPLALVPSEEVSSPESAHVFDAEKKKASENPFKDEQQQQPQPSQHDASMNQNAGPDVFKTFEIKRGRRQDNAICCEALKKKRTTLGFGHETIDDSYQDDVFLKGLASRKVKKYIDEGFEHLTPDTRFSVKAKPSYYLDMNAESPFKIGLDDNSGFRSSIVTRKADEKKKTAKDVNLVNPPKQKLTHSLSHEAPLLSPPSSLNSPKIFDALKRVGVHGKPEAVKQSGGKYPGESGLLASLEAMSEGGASANAAEHPKIAHSNKPSTNTLEETRKGQPLVGTVLVLAKRENDGREGAGSGNEWLLSTGDKVEKRSLDPREVQSFVDERESKTSEQTVEIVNDEAGRRSCGGESNQKKSNFKQTTFPFRQFRNMNGSKNESLSELGNCGDEILESIFTCVEATPHFRRVVGPGLKWGKRKCLEDVAAGRPKSTEHFNAEQNVLAKRIRKILAKFVTDMERLAASDFQTCTKLDPESGRFLQELLEVPHDKMPEDNCGLRQQCKVSIDPIIRGRCIANFDDDTQLEESVDTASLEAMENRRQFVLRLLGEYQNLPESDKKTVQVLGQYLYHELAVLNAALNLSDRSDDRNETSAAPTSTTENPCPTREIICDAAENATSSTECPPVLEKDEQAMPTECSEPTQSTTESPATEACEEVTTPPSNVYEVTSKARPNPDKQNPEDFGKYRMAGNSFASSSRKSGELHKLGYGDAAGLQLSLKSHAPWVSNLNVGKSGGRTVNTWQQHHSQVSGFDASVTSKPFMGDFEDSIDSPQSAVWKYAEVAAEYPDYDPEYQYYEDEDAYPSVSYENCRNE